MSRTVLRWSLLAGIVLAALLASSVVAFEFDRARELGPALGGWFYPPWSVIEWWRAWGHTAPYRHAFQSALTIAAAFMLMPFCGIYLFQMYGPLQMADRRNSGLGKSEDLECSGHIKTRGSGIVLGKSGRRIYRSDGDQHVIMFGLSGSGKSTTTAIPTALTHPGSMLIIDPSATVSEVAGRRRREFGAFHAFDPTKRATARFNPVLELRPGDHLIGDCQMAACLLTNAEKGFGPKDPFWDRSAAYLLSGLLHHVRCSDDPSLGYVWRLLQGIDGQKYPRDVTPFADTILTGFRKREPKLRDSMVATAISHLQFMADPMVQRATDASDFRAGDLQAADAPVTVAVAIPEDQAERLRPLTRLVLQSLLKPLMHDWRRTSDGRAKRRDTLVMIDDFPALGFMELMETGLADGRKYRLRFCLLAQSIEQIERHYGQKQSISSNCATWSVVPGLSERTMDAVIKLAGKHAVVQASKQYGFSLRSNTSMSESETLRAILDPGEMLLRAKDETLIITHNCRPTYLRKIRYWEDRAFRGLFDDPEVSPITSVTVPTATEELPPWLLTHRS